MYQYYEYAKYMTTNFLQWLIYAIPAVSEPGMEEIGNLINHA